MKKIILNARVPGYLILLLVLFTLLLISITPAVSAAEKQLNAISDYGENPASASSDRNISGVDPGIYPSKATWNLGKLLADHMLEDYYSRHGEYPEKVSFSRFDIDFSRDRGVLEAGALYMLGVKPTWDTNGYVNGLVLLNESELLPKGSNGDGRPRIDIVYASDGMRDAFPDKLRMIDEAVRMADLAPAGNYPNYVNESTQAIRAELYNQFLNETGNEIGNETGNETGYESEARELAKTLSTMRCFAVRPGTYELPVSGFVEASGTWEDESEIANVYLDSMGFAYGTGLWGYKCRELLRCNLMNTDASVHSYSSGLYDTLDHDDFYQYFGGLNLASRSVSGKTPDMYILDMEDPNNMAVVSFKEYIARNLRSRYFNPGWIEGVQAAGYDGTSMVSGAVENLWGWKVVVPELVGDEVWGELFTTYIADEELRGRMRENNPSAYQSMVARLIETSRKGYWEPDSGMVPELMREYVNSVIEDGVSPFSAHVGNSRLYEYVRGMGSLAGISPEAMEEYKRIMAEASGGTGDDWNSWDDPFSEGGDKITTSELQEAIYCWLNESPVSGVRIDTQKLQEIILSWLNG